MTRSDMLSFEIYVMDLAKECKTKKDYERLAEELHESIEVAIQDVYNENGIDDYMPSY